MTPDLSAQSQWWGRSVVSRFAFLPAAVAFIAFGLAPSPASAGVGFAVAPVYPASVQTGTTVQATLVITNGSDGIEAGGFVVLSNIRHTPACGTGSVPCPVGQQDPGVFQVATTGVGVSQGASDQACVGRTFDIAVSDVNTGEVLITPNDALGDIVLAPPLTAGDSCRITFMVDVVMLPLHDANAIASDIQTDPSARVTGTSTVTFVVGSGTGTGQTTVVAGVATPTSTPTSTPTAIPTASATHSPTLTNTPVGGPDLVVDGLTVMATAKGNGFKIDLVASVRNLGNAAAGHFSVAFNPDSSAVKGGGNANLNGLAAGAVTTATAKMSAPAGTYGIQVVVDAGNQVAETNEANNVANFVITVP